MKLYLEVFILNPTFSLYILRLLELNVQHICPLIYFLYLIILFLYLLFSKTLIKMLIIIFEDTIRKLRNWATFRKLLL